MTKASWQCYENENRHSKRQPLVFFIFKNPTININKVKDY